MDNIEIHDMSEMAYHSDILDNSDKWDGSSTNQTNDFFIGHSGHVTILWHVANNPCEKYDPSLSYHMPALDGSALYVWCSLEFTDKSAMSSIESIQELLYQTDKETNSLNRL